MERGNAAAAAGVSQLLPVACRSGDRTAEKEVPCACACGGGTHLSARGAHGRTDGGAEAPALNRTGKVHRLPEERMEEEREVKRTTPMAPAQTRR